MLAPRGQSLAHSLAYTRFLKGLALEKHANERIGFKRHYALVLSFKLEPYTVYIQKGLAIFFASLHTRIIHANNI